MCPPYEGSVPEPLRAPTGLALGTAAAGLNATEALARVNLTVTGSAEEFSWDAPVWFCDPGPILRPGQVGD